METQPTPQHSSYEQALMNIIRSLPTFQRVQLLDYALLLQERMVGTAEAKPVVTGDEQDERLWGREAIRSLAKYWDTPEEDEAWAYLQKEK
jgi:hypothetical protein